MVIMKSITILMLLQLIDKVKARKASDMKHSSALTFSAV